MSPSPADLETLSKIANQLRIMSIQGTTEAGSGHPTSCCSAADLVAALFFHQMRFDPKNPRAENNDRFVLSKGHAAPLLYAAWAELGHFPEKEIFNLRKIDSPFEGHPTPRLDFVDVATGSLGQGLSAGAGMAVKAEIDGLSFRTYVLMGDGEVSEGSVWEAASLASTRKLGNLVAIVDVNRLGQSQETAFGHQVEIYRSRFEAFGWKAVTIDGHDMGQIVEALQATGNTQGKPLAIIAKTIKGKGIPFSEDKLDWHGKALSPDQAKEAIGFLKPKSASGLDVKITPPESKKSPASHVSRNYRALNYPKNKDVATRKAYGNALLRVGSANSEIVVLDGDVENSTYALEFSKKYPERFVECYISEQNMVGLSSGLGALGKIPFSATFAAFYSRAIDQIRMTAISLGNIKLCGSHAGVSIGEDGGSQMALEDLASMRAIDGSVVFYPCDAISTERLVEKMAENRGIFYMRTSRPETPILYGNEESFEIGGAKVLKQSAQDQVTVIGAGVTVFEALKAHELLAKDGVSITVIDAYSIKPLARETILKAAAKTRQLVVTVEDHYPEGGLGDTVAGELSSEGVRVHKLAVRELPHSGKKDELMAKYGIDAQAIVKKVRELI